MKNYFIITAAALGILALSSCAQSGPDYRPLGDGLKALGISLVVYGVIKALARFVRADDRKAARQSRAEHHKTRDTNQAGGGEA